MAVARADDDARVGRVGDGVDGLPVGRVLEVDGDGVVRLAALVLDADAELFGQVGEDGAELRLVGVEGDGFRLR